MPSYGWSPSSRRRPHRLHGPLRRRRRHARHARLLGQNVRANALQIRGVFERDPKHIIGRAGKQLWRERPHSRSTTPPSPGVSRASLRPPWSQGLLLRQGLALYGGANAFTPWSEPVPASCCHPIAPHERLKAPDTYVSSLMLDRALDAILKIGRAHV